MKKISIFTMAMLLLFAASVQADLVGLWHLDGDATDSANGYNGTENGDAAYTTEGGGMFGDALSVDGAGNVNCGDISTGDWEYLTTEAWVWWDGTVVSGYAGVYFKAYGGNEDTGRLLINGVGTVLVQNGNGNFWAYNAVSSGQWCHIVYKYDQTEGKEYIYVDGVKEGEQARSGDISGNGYDFLIGYGWWASLYYPFSGLIDEVRIWDEALSEDQILESYALGSSQPDATVVELGEEEISTGEWVIFTSSFYGLDEECDDEEPIDIYIMSNVGATISGVSPRGKEFTPKGTDGCWTLTGLTGGTSTTVTVGKVDCKSIHLSLDLDTGDSVGFNAQFLPYD